MKRKALLLLCLVAAATLLFAACDCEHTFSSSWSKNSTHHWHAATCEHGEIKSAYGAHTDADQDGICNVCNHLIGHEHTYETEWSFDAENHWKNPTCGHDEKGEFGLHADDNLDGKCDSCLTHVHLLDGAGFCRGCNKEIRPVVETDIGSVISATTARLHNVINGELTYSQIGRMKNETGEIAHAVSYLFGTNGTYMKRTYDEVGDDGVKTGNEEVLEKWIRIISPSEVDGIAAISVNGVYTHAEPSAYGVDDLRGYYYAISNMADGYGAEELMLSLYNAYVEHGYGESKIDHDPVNNKYDFKFNVLLVNESVAGEETIYNANYFEISLSFTYADDYTLKSLELTCDCWTSDPGSDPDNQSQTNNEEVDIEYDPVTGTFKFVQYDKANDRFVEATTRPRSDTYTITVTQQIGTRGEIEINDGSEFAPDDFDVFLNEQLTNKATSLNLTVGNTDTVLYLGCTPADAFVSFVRNDFDIVVKDSNGNVSSGIGVYLTGDIIDIIPAKPGSYTIEFTALGKTKTVTANVEGIELGGEKSISLVVTDSYCWVDFYEFSAAKAGTYTFYLPAYFGIYSETKYNSMEAPEVDPFEVDQNFGYNPTVSHTLTITLRPGQTFRFYYGATTKGTFTIGYDEP